MNKPDKSSMVERSTTVRSCRWLFSWRGLRRLLIVLAWLVTVIALLYGEETWRGRRAWNQYRRALEAQGEQLDFWALIPKPVPDEQNFAATPVIKSWFEKKASPDIDPKWEDNYAQIGERVSRPKAKDARAERRFEDLVAWETALAAARSGRLTGQERFYSAKLDAAARAQAAPAVLAGLKTNEALFAELRAASPRPYSRYPVNYDVELPYAIQVPHLGMVKGACQRLRLKACAELAGSQTDQALEDLRLMFRLADSLREDPFFISHLVRLASAQLTVQPIWEGLAEHRWSGAQLRELETRLRQCDFIADMKAPLAAERATGIAIVEVVRRRGPMYLNYLGSCEEAPAATDGKLATLIWFVVVPRGWYDQEALSYCRGFDIQMATVLDTTKQRVSPTQVKADAEAFYQMMYPGGFAGTGLGRMLQHRIIGARLLPALEKVILKSAAAQTAFNQAAIACALERYRLANGHFPEKLEALASQLMAPLPNDVLTGEPYKYRLTEDGRFVLYSVGWDEKDDGGVPGRWLFGDQQGDWVWEYPAT